MEIPKKQMDILLAEVLENHIEDVRGLLVSNGVSGASNMSKADLQIAFLKALKDSASFRENTSRFLVALVQSQANNFTGVDNQHLNVVPNADDVNQPSGTAPKGSFWNTLGGLASQENLNKLFSTGLDTLSSSLKNKANKDSEERALELERLRLQQLQAQKDLQSAGNGALGGTSKGLSTGAWVAIGLGGAILVGTIIYFAVRKN